MSSVFYLKNRSKSKSSMNSTNWKSLLFCLTNMPFFFFFVAVCSSCCFFVLQPLHPYSSSAHWRLDTDLTARTWFPSSWQQGDRAANRSPPGPVLLPDWLAGPEPVVECPSLTSMVPCTSSRLAICVCVISGDVFVTFAATSHVLFM